MGNPFINRLPQLEHANHFKLRAVTFSEVRKMLKELKPRKATGIDGIPSRLLKDGADTLASPLSAIFNLSIQQNMIPGKKGDPYTQVRCKGRPPKLSPHISTACSI